MKTLLIAATLSLISGVAMADCPDKTASNLGTDANKTAGIAKDGTHAPLESNKPADSGTAAQKDGQTMPLANQEGGGNKNLATSQQDVEAQQHGDKTAAAQADDDCKE